MLLLGLAAVIIFATLAPAGLRPRTGHVFLERFAAFFALGAALTMALPRRPWWALIAVVLAAAVLEYAQVLAPGRHARLHDAMEKMAGGVSGVAFAAAMVAAAAWWRVRR